MKFTATARSLGIFSAGATVILLVAYAVTLAVGLSSLESPQQPDRRPDVLDPRGPDHRHDAGDCRAHGGGARLGADAR
jgi:hypothetical protein